MRRRISRVAVAALAVFTVAGLAACGSTDGGARPSPSLAGPRLGQTISIGYTNNEGGAFSLPEFRIGGEVAVDYINAHGGVNGAKIEIIKCLANASPEGSVNCANQAVQGKVAVAYTGIDVASDAALPILSAAGIPYVTTNAWGSAQNTDSNSFLLHSPSAAYAIAPLQTIKDLGLSKVAVVLEDTPAGKDFVNNVVLPLGKGKLGMQVTPVFVDPTKPDWTTAVTTAMAAQPEAIFGQLTEPGCIGLVTATNALGFKGPVMAGSCTAYITALGAKAVGTYTYSDVFPPEARAQAPASIQANLDIYTSAMTAAGQGKYINGFAALAFSAMFELKAILETVPAGTPIDAAAVKAALTAGKTTAGFLGSDVKCGTHPWKLAPANCRGDILVFKVVDNGGTVTRQLVSDGFKDYSSLLA